MKRFIIKIMEFLTLFYAVMLVGTIIVDQLAVPYFIPVKKYIYFLYIDTKIPFTIPFLL